MCSFARTRLGGPPSPAQRTAAARVAAPLAARSRAQCARGLPAVTVCSALSPVACAAPPLAVGAIPWPPSPFARVEAASPSALGMASARALARPPLLRCVSLQWPHLYSLPSLHSPSAASQPQRPCTGALPRRLAPSSRPPCYHPLSPVHSHAHSLRTVNRGPSVDCDVTANPCNAHSASLGAKATALYVFGTVTQHT